MNPVTAALILSYTGNIAQGWTLSGALDTISVSYRKSNTNAWLGTLSRATVIQSGVTSWLSGFSTHNIYGNLANYGNLVVSQTDSVVSIYGGQTCDWTGADDSNGNLQNKAGANILLHDVSALSAPTYDWYLNNFQNDGAIQWCGRGDTGGSTYQLYCRNNCVNTGLIVFEQVYGNLGTSAVWRNYALTPASSNPTQTITNNGGFLMRQMRVDFVQNYLGTGCWMVGNKAVMYMQDGVGAYQNYQYGSSLSGQSISFLDNTGVIHMDTQVYSHNSAFGARVYGFGAGNAIEFYETIKSFSYSSNILTVGFIGGNSVKINIGTGYSASGFSSAKRASTYGYFNSIYYSGSAPAVSRPSQCRMTAAVCTAKVPTTFSSTISCPADDSDSSSSTLATVVKVAQTATTSTTTSSIAKTTSTTSSTSAKTTSSSTNVVVKVATTAQMTSSTSTTQSTSSSSTKATKATTSAAVQATTTASTTTSAATAFPTFYLLSSCDGSCLGHFADDNQIFSNLYSADDNTYDTYYLNGTQLYDASTGTLCVASEAGGSETRLQCSGDLDSINGVDVVGGFGFSSSSALTYGDAAAWYGCGVLNLADNYEPTGLTYSRTNGDDSVCRACSLVKTTNLSQCGGQTAATTITTSVLPTYSAAV